MYSAVLEFNLGSEEKAGKLLDSLKTDNEGYVKSSIEGNKIILKIGSDNIASLRNTIDDLLACADLAYNIIVREE